ncbi:hypothetical protein DL96DRAFT_1564012 [Flagelloscypha sp. PMI_526]|nr:hypothetical protein DL96DRAFT_1564012 [Flagelloscypha sp. PMI_526]
MPSYSDILHLSTPEDFLRFNSDVAVASGATLLVGGVYLMLTLMALRDLRRHAHPRAMPNKIVHWTIIFLWLIFTASIALQVARLMLEIRWPRLTSPEIPLGERYISILDRQMGLQLAMNMLQPIPVQPVPNYFDYSIQTYSLDIVGIGRFALEYLAVAVVNLHGISPYLYPAQLSFSIAVNGAATIAIGIKAWQHRVLTRDIRNASSGPVYILIVVVEAGAFLCFTQMMNLAMFIVGVLIDYKIDSPFLLAASVLSAFGDTVVAAYPALIVTVLSFRGSVLEKTTSMLFSTVIYEERESKEVQQRGGRLTTIQFAGSSQSLDSVTDASRGSLHTKRKAWA